MRNILFYTFFLVVCFSSCIKEEKSNFSTSIKKIYQFKSEERKREFILYQPAGIDLSLNTPMVMIFHGTGGDGEKFYNISKWKELADREKFYAIFPTALAYCIEEDGVKEVATKWNVYGLQDKVCNNDKLVNDFDFVAKMIDTIKKYYPIDPNKIYASGFSNGGTFTYQLGIELSDKIAAIAPAGVFLKTLGHAPKQLIPIFHLLGARDPLILENLSIASLPTDASLLTTQGAKFSYLAVCNTFQLDSSIYKMQSSAYGGVKFYWGTPKNNGGNNNFYQWEVLSDCFHQYPNGSNHPMIAAEEFWKFFKGLTK